MHRQQGITREGLRTDETAAKLLSRLGEVRRRLKKGFGGSSSVTSPQEAQTAALGQHNSHSYVHNFLDGLFHPQLHRSKRRSQRGGRVSPPSIIACAPSHRRRCSGEVSHQRSHFQVSVPPQILRDHPGRHPKLPQSDPILGHPSNIAGGTLNRQQLELHAQHFPDEADEPDGAQHSFEYPPTRFGGIRFHQHQEVEASRKLRVESFTSKLFQLFSILGRTEQPISKPISERAEVTSLEVSADRAVGAFYL